MKHGYFVKAFNDFKFHKPTENRNLDISNNIQVFSQLIAKLPADVKLLAFDFDFPFGHHADEISFIGHHEKELIKIGELLKSKGLRICSIFSDAKNGLAASEHSDILKTRNQLLKHAEFYDMCRLGFENIIFMPYGDPYLGDYHKYRNQLNALPRYARNRVGIFDVNNFSSMVVAGHNSLPWIFDIHDELDEKGIIEKAIKSFEGFPIQPGIRPIMITRKKNLKIAKGMIYNDIDLIIEGKYPVKKTIKKMRLKNAATVVSRATVTKNK